LADARCAPHVSALVGKSCLQPSATFDEQQHSIGRDIAEFFGKAQYYSPRPAAPRSDCRSWERGPQRYKSERQVAHSYPRR
jgi:hypothetical protein